MRRQLGIEADKVAAPQGTLPRPLLSADETSASLQLGEQFFELIDRLIQNAVVEPVKVAGDFLPNAVLGHRARTFRIAHSQSWIVSQMIDSAAAIGGRTLANAPKAAAPATASSV